MASISKALEMPENFPTSIKASDIKASIPALKFEEGYLAYKDKGSGAALKFEESYLDVNIKGSASAFQMEGTRRRSSMGVGNQLEIVTVACLYERPFVIRFRIWNDTNLSLIHISEPTRPY